MGNATELATAAGRSASIDWDFIRQQEADIPEPYLPISKAASSSSSGPSSSISSGASSSSSHYQVNQNSGVTVGMGVDLGKQSLNTLLVKIKDPAVRESLRVKLRPFFGANQKEAVARMNAAGSSAVRSLQSAEPELMSAFGIQFGDDVRSDAQVGRVTNLATGKQTGMVLRLGWFARREYALTPAELAELDSAIKGIYTDTLLSHFDRQSKSHKLQFALLPKDAQTALMSFHYQTGSLPGGKHHQKFWAAATCGDLEEAAKLFKGAFVSKAGAKNVRRRQAELRLLEQAVVFNRSNKPASSSAAQLRGFAVPPPKPK
jgi:hypothetical protein